CRIRPTPTYWPRWPVAWVSPATAAWYRHWKIWATPRLRQWVSLWILCGNQGGSAQVIICCYLPLALALPGAPVFVVPFSEFRCFAGSRLICSVPAIKYEIGDGAQQICAAVDLVECFVTFGVGRERALARTVNSIERWIGSFFGARVFARGLAEVT